MYRYFSPADQVVPELEKSPTGRRDQVSYQHRNREDMQYPTNGWCVDVGRQRKTLNFHTSGAYLTIDIIHSVGSRGAINL